MDEQDASWKLIAVCALLVGLPGYAVLGFATGAIVHLVTVALFAFALFCFGRNSIIESTIMVLVLATLLSILLSIFIRSREKSLLNKIKPAATIDRQHIS